MTIDTDSRIYKVSDFKRLLDAAGGRARTAQTRTPTTPNFNGQAPAKLLQGVDGAVAYNVNARGKTTRVTDKVEIDARRADSYHHPLTIVRAALDPAARLTNLRALANENILDIATANGVALTLAVDKTTKLPTSVVSMTADDNILGEFLQAVKDGFDRTIVKEAPPYRFTSPN